MSAKDAAFYMIALDRKVNEYCLSHTRPGPRRIFQAFSFLGTGLLWICIYAFCLIFFWNHAHRLIFALILAELMGLMLIVPLRYITRRERPCRHYKCFFLTPWNRYSFPSHHAFRAFSIAVIAGMQFPGAFPLLLGTAAVIGFSRIYLSRHYLSDVLVGTLLAAAVSTASLRIVGILH